MLLLRWQKKKKISCKQCPITFFTFSCCHKPDPAQEIQSHGAGPAVTAQTHRPDRGAAEPLGRDDSADRPPPAAAAPACAAAPTVTDCHKTGKLCLCVSGPLSVMAENEWPTKVIAWNGPAHGQTGEKTQRGHGILRVLTST